MSFVTLLNSSELSLSTDQLVLSPREINSLTDVAETADHLTLLLEKYEQTVLASKNKGFDEGFDEGKERGLLDARKELAEQLTALTGQYQLEQQKMKASVVKLAMQVVRRVAGEIGAPEVVAGIAQKAADELISDDFLILQVHPSALERVKKQLQSYTDKNITEEKPNTSSVSALQQTKPLYIEVRSGEALSEFDCLINTKFGTTVAGLDDQLMCLEKIITKKLTGVSPLESKESIHINHLANNEEMG